MGEGGGGGTEGPGLLIPTVIFSSALLSCLRALILDYQMENGCLSPRGTSEHVPGGQFPGLQGCCCHLEGRTR